MKWISSYLSDEQIKKISDSVAQAETKTRGEIVPVIVRSSTGDRHIPLLIALFAMVGLLMIDHERIDFLYVFPYQFLWIPIFLVCLGLGVLLAKVDPIKRILLSDKDEREAVFRRAQVEFYQNQVHRTHEGVGILIFVSVLEHRAVILGDRLISEKVGQKDWDKILGTLLENIKGKKWESALTQAVEQAGDLLATHFPMRENEVNELSNQLVIKD